PHARGRGRSALAGHRRRGLAVLIPGPGAHRLRVAASTGPAEGVDGGDVLVGEPEVQGEVALDALPSRRPGQDHDVVLKMPPEDDLRGRDAVPPGDAGENRMTQIGVLEAAVPLDDDSPPPMLRQQ